MIVAGKILTGWAVVIRTDIGILMGNSVKVCSERSFGEDFSTSMSSFHFIVDNSGQDMFQIQLWHTESG